MARLSDQEYITQIYYDTCQYITKFLLLKCSNTDDISDLLQNTYANFTARVKSKGQAHILVPKHYLLRIAKDELAKYYNKKGKDIEKQVSFEEAESEFEEMDETFLMEQCAEDKFICEEIWVALKTIDEVTVKIVSLRFLYDMGLAEIAEKLDMPLSSVKSKFYRGLGKVRERMAVEAEVYYE